MENTYKNLSKRFTKLKCVTATKVNMLVALCDKPVVYVLLAVLVYTFRAREYIIRPQLFAEDGAVWLADGFNKGLSSVVTPLNGFYHVPERLFGYVVSHLPLQFAPIIFNFSALVIFGVLIYYLFTSRANILSGFYERVFMIFCIFLIGNIDELFFNFSNSIFLLGVIGLLILVTENSRRSYVNSFEKILYALSCLTLPFVWFYLPIAGFELKRKRLRDKFYLYFAVIGGTVQAIYFLVFASAQRSVVTLQSLISKDTIIEVYNQIAIPALRFTRIDVNPMDGSRYGLVTACITIAALGYAVALIFIQTNRQVRYLLLFLAAMTLAALKSPFIATGTPSDAIKFMSTTPAGDRYFVFGIIAVYVIIVKMFSSYIKSPAKVALSVTFILLGIVTTWHNNTFYIQKNFTDYTSEYTNGIDELKNNPSKKISIPVNPGGDWKIRFNEPHNTIY